MEKISTIGSKRISRVCLALICGQFYEVKTPSPNEIVREKSDSKPSDKKRQKATMNLSQFVALTCRLLPSAVTHMAAVMKETRPFCTQTSSLNTAWGHDRRRNCCAKFAQLLRNKFNAIKHHSTRLNINRFCAGIIRPSHTQDKRKGAAKSEN
jgi:hypothetical protein